MTTMIIKNFFLLLFALSSFSSFGQVTEGYIKFERKMNLFKKFPDPQTQKWIGEKNKYSIDHYRLYFNEDKSVFIPDPDDPEKEGMLKWIVLQHSEIQDLKNKKNTTLLNFFGQVAVVKDSLKPRNWKYTGKGRIIANYECKQVLLHVNDSTRLYAWFTPDILPSIGPENFWGLPGAILGVAAEDGRTTYFAKEVIITKVDFDKITPKYSDKKVSTFQELKTQMEKDFGSRKEAKPIIDDVLIWQYYE